MDALKSHETGCEKRQQEINKEFDSVKQGIRDNRNETRWLIGIGVAITIAISQQGQASPIIINGAGTPTPSVALNNEPLADQ